MRTITLAAVFCLAGTANAGNPADCHAGDAFVCAIEARMTDLVNDYRASSGLPEVAHHSGLGYVSREWSRSQGERGVIGHEGFPAQRNATYSAEFGDMGSVSIRSENVAMFGWSDDDADRIARRFVSMWWNSDGHRRNILGRHAIHGAGVWRNAAGHWYATQLFGDD